MRLIYSLKSQVTIFLIIGITLLLGAVTVFIVSSGRISGDAEAIDDVRLDSNSIIRHVESCILKTRQTIRDITRNAGELSIVEPLLYNGITYNYWCRQTANEGCKNKVFSKLKLEKELNYRLKPIIDDCIDFSEYELMGYQINRGISEIETIVGSSEINIRLNLPLSFERGDFFYEHSEFSYRFNTFVGRMFEVANMILNEEIQNYHFDKDEWMKEHGAEIIIEKRKPYPDTVYHLSRIDSETEEWLELNFAINGRDTVSRPSRVADENPFGWCKEGDICFFNPSESACEGTLHGAKPNDCIDVSENLYPVCTDDCLPCGDREHGDEWCEFEGPAGNGWDFPGTRHYKMSCINGYIFVEECRDYRDELCSEANGKAICRPNRWKTCTHQTTKQDCEDSSQRDCMWAETVKNDFNKPERYGGNPRTYCVPQVPPGFIKGSPAGMEVCQLSNEWMDCYGLTCPFVWSETSMIQCSRLGDCGKGYNIGGGLSNFSFITTDMLDNPDGPSVDLLLGPEFIGRSYSSLNAGPLNYEFENFNSNVFDCDDCNFNHIMNRVEEYIDYLTSLSVSDLILEYLLNGKIELTTRHFNICLPFMTEDEGNCESCYDPLKPCTRYRCENIGNNCFFYQDDQGYGRCRSADTTLNPPVIIMNTFSVNPYNPLREEVFSGEILGRVMENPVPAFSPFTIKFRTTKPARCSTTPLPLGQDIGAMIPNVISMFNDPEPGFKTEHAVQIHALPPEYFNILLDDITELYTAIGIIEDNLIDDMLDELIEEFSETARSYSSFPGVSSSMIDSAIQEMEEMRDYYRYEIKPELENMIESLRYEILEYFHSMNEGYVYQFIDCIDANGAQTEQSIYVKYQIGEDNEPPQALSKRIIDDSADNNIATLEIIMNEPVECRASVGLVHDLDFEDMNYEMECNRNFLAVERGYKCTIGIPKTRAHCYNDVGGVNFGRIYFKCRDKIYQPDISESNINPTSFMMRFEHDCSRWN